MEYGLIILDKNKSYGNATGGSGIKKGGNIYINEHNVVVYEVYSSSSTDTNLPRIAAFINENANNSIQGVEIRVNNQNGQHIGSFVSKKYDKGFIEWLNQQDNRKVFSTQMGILNLPQELKNYFEVSNITNETD